MEQWLNKRLTECLQFEVPAEMIKFVMTLKDAPAIDNYFESLLDVSMPEHRQFLNEFKERVAGKGQPNDNKSKKSQKAKPPNNPFRNADTSKNANEAKSSADKKPTNSNKPAQTAASSSQKSAPSKKQKSGYTNLYGQDGTMNDVILLKGRRLCNCEAAKHKLINNCIRCGRIVCEQEGSGPCLFCGNLVCTDGEQRIIESESSSGKQLKKSLSGQERPKGWEEAVAMRNRLIDYDRMSEKRTTVIDDESDYFRTNSVWLTDQERSKLKKIEQKMNEQKYASRREQKVTIDFGGRAVIDEPLISAEFEDEIIREIAQTVASGNHGNMMSSLAANNSDACDPNLEFPMPIFDERVLKAIAKGKGVKPAFDGVYNRVQDKELLEVSDMKKCMSMHQPWASLLVAGIKRHEGRSWYTSHRGRLWIASTAKPVDPETVKEIEGFYRRHYDDDSIEFPTQYPSGCLLGCVSVQECLPQEEYRSVHPNGESESPFVFICSNPQELPIKFPIQGAHKIYKLDDSIHIAAAKALQRMAKIQGNED